MTLVATWLLTESQRAAGISTSVPNTRRSTALDSQARPLKRSHELPGLRSAFDYLRRLRELPESLQVWTGARAELQHGARSDKRWLAIHGHRVHAWPAPKELRVLFTVRDEAVRFPGDS
jgi:hypothetical protein